MCRLCHVFFACIVMPGVFYKSHSCYRLVVMWPFKGSSIFDYIKQQAPGVCFFTAVVCSLVLVL